MKKVQSVIGIAGLLVIIILTIGLCTKKIKILPTDQTGIVNNAVNTVIDSMQYASFKDTISILGKEKEKITQELNDQKKETATYKKLYEQSRKKYVDNPDQNNQPDTDDPCERALNDADNYIGSLEKEVSILEVQHVNDSIMTSISLVETERQNKVIENLHTELGVTETQKSEMITENNGLKSDKKRIRGQRNIFAGVAIVTTAALVYIFVKENQN